MKINPMCDLLVGNRPENDSDTQYYECEDCYRYEICKNYGCVEMCSIKEIKEATPNIIEPSYDSLKQEGYFEMSMISEQVKELRKLANSKEFEPHEPVAYGFYARIKSKLFKAADTIEALSAKLAAANMERSDRYYGGGWIACEDRLPDKDDTVLIDTGIGYFEIATYSGDGRTFYTEECGSSCPIAWQPLPEPYRP